MRHGRELCTMRSRRLRARLRTGRSPPLRVKAARRTYTARSTRAFANWNPNTARTCTPGAVATIKWRQRLHFTRTMVVATTHWQPAQPVLLAFWLLAAAEPFARAAKRFRAAAEAAAQSCPLG